MINEDFGGSGITLKYKGSCHCGKVAFEVEDDVAAAMARDCPMCLRRSSLLWFVLRANLRLLTPESDAASDTFKRHMIPHRFCAACLIHAFGEGTDSNGNAMAAVNLRWLEGVEIASVAVRRFDGRALWIFPGHALQ